MIRLFIRSLQLDLEFLTLSINFRFKLLFLFKKYWVLVRELFHPFFTNNKKTYIFNRPYFYDDKYGLAVLQGTFIDNKFLKKFLQKGSVVVDVGANIGQFNLFCKYFLGAKRVYSFEPVKETFEILKDNCGKDTYNYAISSKKSLKFYVGNLSVWGSVFKQNEKSKEVLVQGISLNSFKPLDREKVIDLLKIDTEGGELDVLRVSGDLLKKSRYVLIEVPFVRSADSNFFQILQNLKKVVPKAEIVRIGRVYNSFEDGTTGAADILFKNNQLL